MCLLKKEKSLTFLNEVSISVLSTRKKKSEVRSMERGVTRELCTAKSVSQMWWHTPGVPELEQLRQEDLTLVLHSEIMSQ